MQVEKCGLDTNTDERARRRGEEWGQGWYITESRSREGESGWGERGATMDSNDSACTHTHTYTHWYTHTNCHLDTHTHHPANLWRSSNMPLWHHSELRGTRSWSELCTVMRCWEPSSQLRSSRPLKQLQPVVGQCVLHHYRRWYERKSHLPREQEWCHMSLKASISGPGQSSFSTAAGTNNSW